MLQDCRPSWIQSEVAGQTKCVLERLSVELYKRRQAGVYPQAILGTEGLEDLQNWKLTTAIQLQ